MAETQPQWRDPKTTPRAHPLSTTTFFDTDQSELKTTTPLGAFARHYQEGPIVIEGYCDYRGDTDYNYQLGLQRADAVGLFLAARFLEMGKTVPAILRVSLGENHGRSGVLARDRKAVVTAKTNLFERAFSHISADVYLIDASGSMTEAWSDVSQFQFPRGSAVYSFNSCNGVQNGLMTPRCDTPLWQSTYDVIATMKAGARLLVVTDGEDTTVCPGVDSVIEFAKRHRVHVHTAFIGGTITPKGLVKLAKDTGGVFYIQGEDALK
jgi:hypothetical protein